MARTDDVALARRLHIEALQFRGLANRLGQELANPTGEMLSPYETMSRVGGLNATVGSMVNRLEDLGREAALYHDKVAAETRDPADLLREATAAGIAPDIFTDIWNKLNEILGALNKIVTQTTTTADALKGTVTGPLTNIIAGGTSTIGSVIRGMGTSVGTISSTAGNILSQMVSIGGNVVGTLADILAQLGNLGLEALGGIVNALKVFAFFMSNLWWIAPAYGLSAAAIFVGLYPMTALPLSVINKWLPLGFIAGGLAGMVGTTVGVWWLATQPPPS